MNVPRAPGFSSMMKEGSKYMAGLEEAVLRNIGKFFNPLQGLDRPQFRFEAVFHRNQVFHAPIFSEIEWQFPEKKVKFFPSNFWFAFFFSLK